MSETVTTETSQGQSKTEVGAGLDRLSQDPNWADKITTTTKEPEKTATEETTQLENQGNQQAQVDEAATKAAEELKAKAKELNLPETATKEEIEAAEKAKTTQTTTQTTETKTEGFVDDNTNQLAGQEGTWRAVLEAKGFEVPADYDEEKGFEIYEQAQQAKHQAELEQARTLTAENVFEIVPEEHRAEARLVFELMAHGQTLEQINAPFQSIAALKALSPEQLIRKNFEGMGNLTEEEINYKMEQLATNGHIEMEHKLLLKSLDQMEAGLNAQRQQDIEIFKQRQQQIQEQKRQQEYNTFKASLDRLPTFMDRKLTDENKRTILNEYANGAVEKLISNPQNVAEFMLWQKYGKQGLKYLQDRVREELTVEFAKKQHNIPTVTSAGGNQNRSTQTTTNHSSGMDRLQADERYK